MTDTDQVLAKVRAAAEAIERAQASLPARRDRVPADDTFTICARAALAMVEQAEDCIRHRCDHGARTVSALRTAVGE